MAVVASQRGFGGIFEDMAASMRGAAGGIFDTRVTAPLGSKINRTTVGVTRVETARAVPTMPVNTAGRSQLEILQSKLQSMTDADLLSYWLWGESERHQDWIVDNERSFYLNEIQRRGLALPAPIDTSWWPLLGIRRSDWAKKAVALARTPNDTLASDFLANERQRPSGWADERPFYVAEFRRRQQQVPTLPAMPAVQPTNTSTPTNWRRVALIGGGIIGLGLLGAWFFSGKKKG